MPPLKKYTPPKQGDPVFVVIRNGKLVRYPNGAIRTFYSEEHFKEHKKTYGMNFLPTDVLVKYVPEIVEEEQHTMNQEKLKQRLIELLSTAGWNLFTSGSVKAEIADHLIANGVTIREDEKPTEDGTTIRAKNIKFNTGDYARIVDNESGHYFAIGTIVQLEKHETDYLATDVNGCNWWVVDNDLESADVADWAGVKDEFEERNT